MELFDVPQPFWTGEGANDATGRAGGGGGDFAGAEDEAPAPPGEPVSLGTKTKVGRCKVDPSLKAPGFKTSTSWR